MTAPLSILVVLASPDDRDSTSSLRLAVDELRSRRDIDVSVWFLRSWAPEVPWEGARVVDSLRTWAGTNILSAVGLDVPAGWLRGRKLRAWLREAAPDVALLDDGIGDRVLAPLTRRPLRVVRVNDELPADAFAEPRLDPEQADVVISPPGADVVPSVRRQMEMGELHDLAFGRRMRDPARRRAVLEALGVPTDAPVVLGWGEDGWIDGPELFIRGLWTLEARHGLTPTGVWLGMPDDAHSIERLQSEAERCGVGERFFLRAEAPHEARFCGDVTFLPVRTIIDDEDMILAMAAGSRVVTFEVNAAPDLPVVAVPDLDLEAAAEQLASAIRDGIAEPLSIDVTAWADRLLSLIQDQRAR